jgi:hypothetical protein
MKTFLFLLLLPFSAQAGTISCAVDPLYTQAWIRWDEKTVSVEVYNPRGFKSMPQMEAPFSQESIPFLETQSKQLETLGGRFVYSWERKQCEFSPDDKWLVTCHGGAKSGPDNGIQAASFTTAHIEEKSLSANFSVFRLRMLFDKSSLYFAAIPFPLERCQYQE